METDKCDVVAVLTEDYEELQDTVYVNRGKEKKNDS